MKTNQHEISIVDLNYYCLEIILEYLTMEDHISFAETCSYFRLVFKNWASHFYNKFILVAYISKYELKILTIVSEDVRKLIIDVDDLVVSLADNYAGKANYYFKQFCSLIVGMHQLQSLNLYQYKKKTHAKRILIRARNLSQLKQLHITDHKCKNALLRPFGNLELLSLDVQFSSKELLKSCKSMVNLRELHLTRRVGISYLKDTILLCPNLKELSFYIKPQHKVRYCTDTQDNCTVKIFAALADKAKNLISLNVMGTITDFNQAEQLARIISLKALTCSFSNPDCVRVLRQLSLLEELRISLVYCTVDISSIYLELIRTCTHLRLLSILDFNIQKDFVIKISKVLKEFDNRRPLELFIYGHRDSTILRTSRDIDGTHLIYTRMNAQELIKLL